MLLLLQYAPEEYIYRAGEIANEMFFIVSGAVDELAENAEVLWMQVFVVCMVMTGFCNVGRGHAAQQSRKNDPSG